MKPTKGASAISILLTVVLVVVVLFTVGFFIWAFRNPLILENPGRLFHPDVEVLDVVGTDHVFSPLDYGYRIRATLNNKGTSGTVLVRAIIRGEEENWTKEQAVNIKQGETKEIIFNFREPRLFEETFGFKLNIVQ